MSHNLPCSVPGIDEELELIPNPFAYFAARFFLKNVCRHTNLKRSRTGLDREIITLYCLILKDNASDHTTYDYLVDALMEKYNPGSWE